MENFVYKTCSNGEKNVGMLFLYTLNFLLTKYSTCFVKKYTKIHRDFSVIIVNRHWIFFIFLLLLITITTNKF